jgi:hypothetical protein
MATYLVLYALTMITAIIHAYMGLVSLGESLGLILVLNGIGYAGLLIFHFMIEWRGFGTNYHHYILMLYTAATIGAYFVTFPLSDAISNVPGMATKVVEVAMIILLLRIISKSRKRPVETAN